MKCEQESEGSESGSEYDANGGNQEQEEEDDGEPVSDRASPKRDLHFLTRHHMTYIACRVQKLHPRAR